MPEQQLIERYRLLLLKPYTPNTYWKSEKEWRDAIFGKIKELEEIILANSKKVV